MIDLTERERLHLVSCWPTIVRLVKGTNDPKCLEKIRDIMPLYQLEITYREDGSRTCAKTSRTFTYMNRKKKGKKRIYISTDTKKTLYIRFISKQTIKQLCKGSDVPEDWAELHLGDKWFIVSELVHFKTIFQLINHTLALEVIPTRANHPMEGEKSWTAAEELINVISQFRSMKSNCHVYGVHLRRYLWR